MTGSMAVVPVRLVDDDGNTYDVKNWADKQAKPRVVARTSIKTYVVTNAVAPGIPQNVQVCEYETSRIRTVIQVLDVTVVLTFETPTTAADTTTASTPPANNGRVLPNNTAFEYVFYGPDPMWIVATSGPTRVTVTREYC